MATATAAKLLTHKGKVPIVSCCILPHGRWQTTDSLMPDYVTCDVSLDVHDPLPILHSHEPRQVLGWVGENARLLHRPNGWHLELALWDDALGRRALREAMNTLWEQATCGGLSTREPDCLRGSSLGYVKGRDSDGKIDAVCISEISLTPFPKRYSRATALSLEWRPAESWAAEPLLEEVSYVDA